ncbi:hypothetical protein COCNU_03G002490 [Cocos nucifera]|uniref:Uncharacterized protein n=1 Tax=Cocos nucifera TaxID=13894 RepID=A0A8K0I2M7_COCNU|nr:hypothetical protein COCNU_03G002490 [Cocos nucifera]
MHDMAMLGKDLLHTMMPKRDLHIYRRDLRLDELLNQGFSSILDSVRDCQKIAKEKATKEAKVVEVLKKQLQEKFNEIKEKNKTLMDHQKKIHKGEKRLLELQQEISRILDLETKVVEYKSFEAFEEEVTEALGEAFDNGFNICKSLVGKFFSNLNLSDITQEAGLALASEENAQATSNVGSPVDAPQSVPEVIAEQPCPLVKAPVPAEVPAPAPAPAPTKASAIEVISLEDDQAASPAKALQANA